MNYEVTSETLLFNKSTPSPSIGFFLQRKQQERADQGPCARPLAPDIAPLASHTVQVVERTSGTNRGDIPKDHSCATNAQA